MTEQSERQRRETEWMEIVIEHTEMVGNRRECHGKAEERWRRSEKIRYMTKWAKNGPKMATVNNPNAASLQYNIIMSILPAFPCITSVNKVHDGPRKLSCETFTCADFLFLHEYFPFFSMISNYDPKCLCFKGWWVSLRKICTIWCQKRMSTVSLCSISSSIIRMRSYSPTWGYMGKIHQQNSAKTHFLIYSTFYYFKNFKELSSRW